MTNKTWNQWTIVSKEMVFWISTNAGNEVNPIIGWSMSPYSCIDDANVPYDQVHREINELKEELADQLRMEELHIIPYDRHSFT